MVNLILLIGSLVVIPEEFNFGYFPMDQEVRMSFEIKNNSRYPVRILKVFPYCSCLEIENYDTIIYPFSKAKVHYQFSSQGMSGPFHKQILIRTDRFGYQYLKFSIKGFVYDPPIQPLWIDLNKSTTTLIIYHHLWSSSIKIQRCPSFLLTRFDRQNGITHLQIYTLKRRAKGCLQLRIGRKLVTLPFRS